MTNTLFNALLENKKGFVLSLVDESDEADIAEISMYVPNEFNNIKVFTTKAYGRVLVYSADDAIPTDGELTKSEVVKLLDEGQFTISSPVDILSYIDLENSMIILKVNKEEYLGLFDKISKIISKVSICMAQDNMDLQVEVGVYDGLEIQVGDDNSMFICMSQISKDAQLGAMINNIGKGDFFSVEEAYEKFVNEDDGSEDEEVTEEEIPEDEEESTNEENNVVPLKTGGVEYEEVDEEDESDEESEDEEDEEDDSEEESEDEEEEEDDSEEEEEEEDEEEDYSEEEEEEEELPKRNKNKGKNNFYKENFGKNNGKNKNKSKYKK